MLRTPSREYQIRNAQVLFEQAWNTLIPRCAVRAEVKPFGVRYLHPTKGHKFVGKRRFAIRGVM